MGHTDRPHDFTGLNVIALPVSLSPRHGKYYGTEIVDANGDEVMRIWTVAGEPSSREKAHFGEDYTPEAWADYCSDSHWECEADLKRAEWVVSALNDAMTPVYKGGEGYMKYAIERYSVSVDGD
jgi:hypothetical protein